MLCSKFHCLKSFILKHISYKIGVIGRSDLQSCAAEHGAFRCMVRSNRGRDSGRDTRRAVGSWSHQLPSAPFPSCPWPRRTADHQTKSRVPRGRVVRAGSCKSCHRDGAECCCRVLLWSVAVESCCEVLLLSVAAKCFRNMRIFDCNWRKVFLESSTAVRWCCRVLHSSTAVKCCCQVLLAGVAMECCCQVLLPSVDVECCCRVCQKHENIWLHLTQSVFKVVLRKPISAQIRQLFLYMSNSKR